MSALTPILVPGLGGSGPDHWQSLWHTALPNAVRVDQADWDRPAPADWIARLEETIRRAPRRSILIAHSLACALVAHWAARHDTRCVAGALLVAPADVDSPDRTPPEAHCFAPMPLAPLPFPALVVASGNDPFVDHGRARAFAAAWQAGFIDAGSIGHINAGSGLGAWPEGRGWLDDFMRGLTGTSARTAE